MVPRGTSGLGAATAVLGGLLILLGLAAGAAGEPSGVHAEQYDRLFNLYLVIGTVASVLVLGWLVWMAVAFRHKQETTEPEDAPSLDRAPQERGDKRWMGVVTLVILVVLMGLSAGTLDMVALYEHTPEDEGPVITINVTGTQYLWLFEYPNGNSSYSELTVPVDTVIELRVTSRDVFHNFAIPDLRIKTDAIPDWTNTIWFKVDKVGEHDLYCMELCGEGHASMTGTLKVVEKAVYTGGGL